MLRTIADRPGISVTTVVETFCSQGGQRLAADAHWSLGRLFKYGLVTSIEECTAIGGYRGALEAVTNGYKSSTL